jgi:hypothetical protein
MRCGQPATLYKNMTFSWHSPWLAVVHLVAGPLALILALASTKRMNVSVPLCERHKNHWLVRTVASVGGFFLVLALVISSPSLFSALDHVGAGNNDVLNLVKSVACVGAVVALLVWLIAIAVMQSTAIRATEITDDDIWLTGISQAYLDAARAHVEEEYARRRAARSPRPDAFREEDE